MQLLLAALSSLLAAGLSAAAAGPGACPGVPTRAAPHVYAQRARELRDAGQGSDAGACYRQCASDHADDASAHNDLAMWLATAQSGGGGGDVPGAIGAYRRALALEPSGKGWTNLGVLIQKHLGRLEDKKGDALKAYKQAVKVDPDLAEGYYNLGAFYEKDRQHEAALRAYSWAVELDPEQGHYFTNLAGVHISLEQSDKAYQAYEKALEVNPKLPDAWVGLGNIEGSRGRLDLAVIRYKKALKVQPKHAKAKRRLKQAKADMSKEKEAMKANADKMQALEDTAEQCGNNVACMQARLVANGVGKRTHDGRVEL